MKITIFKFFIIFLIVASLLGCSTLVRFESEPPGAKVYVDEEYIGDTPIEKQLSDFVGNKYRLRLEKEGHKTIRTEIDKEVKVLTLVLGLFTPTWIPLLWCYGPKSFQRFELKTDETQTSSSTIINSRPDIIVLVDGEEISFGSYNVSVGEHIVGFELNGEYYESEPFFTEEGLIYEIN